MTPELYRRCPHCDTRQPANNFEPGRTICTRCHAERKAEKAKAYRARRAADLRARTPEQVEADRARVRPDGLQTCNRCCVALPFSAFAPDLRRLSGLNQTCSPCRVTRAQEKYGQLHA
ncbi:hypothetical protein [Microcella alkalica]|uniref:hypothetical protein n=1 Tax=Microcella alkalica TaxID=355930 RepID=UPI00145EEB8B|nr:hypothetical protein [Microcella alkalica]